MTGKHHLIVGTVVGGCAAASVVLSGNHPLWLGGCVFATTALGSLLPDIDSRTSKLGKKMKIASFLANKIFGHRGFLHSPIFIFVVTLLSMLLFEKQGWDAYYPIWVGIIIGMVTHLVCDMTTKGGIPLLYPLQKWKFSISPMKSGSKWEFIPLIIICVISVALTVVFMMSGTFI